ncbi:MAG: PhnD/SsuA/transferrin family substrate-binding protein [Melioribacteraceae bacterium]|nr:PhnD/SsuA/transferrin family substrate-binding protein [Melioribacteraceae bacterium]
MNYNEHNLRGRIIYFTLVLFILSEMIAAQPKQLILNFGYYTKDFNKSNITEIDESLKRWAEVIKKNTKIEMLVNSVMNNQFYTTIDEMIDKLSDNKLDFINISAIDYYKHDLKNKIVPILTTAKTKESKYERYLLVTHISSAVSDFTKMPNSQIVIPNSYSSGLVKLWLEVELKEKMKNKKSKIVLVESNKNENEALFSIFFKKTDFAVIREDSYDIACELNPQIKKNTKIISKSAHYINAFFAHRKNYDPEITEEIVKVGMNMDKSVEGKQILNLMLTNCMHQIELKDLHETENLIKQHNKYYRLKN